MRETHVHENVLASAWALRNVAIMGICNVTPDSFSDGGLHFTFADACARVDTLIAEGADIIDIGGESTRPRSKPVSPQIQLDRVLEVVRYASKKRVLVSVDTTSAEVAESCLRAGAGMVNDVSCLRDSNLATVTAEFGASLCVMHSRGSQEEMSGFSEYPENAYTDVLTDVISEWLAAANRARACGIQHLVMDPGFGFSKNAAQSAALLRNTAKIVGEVGVPVMIGASRKSFLKLVDPDAAPSDRVGASVAAAVFAVRAGAKIVRVHDVRATRQAIDLSLRLEAPDA